MCEWTKWAPAPAAVLLVSAKPREDVPDATHCLWFFAEDDELDTRGEKWNADAPEFARLNYATFFGAIARLRPRLVVVAPEMEGRFAQVFPKFEPRASFTALCKPRDEVLHFLAAPLAGFLASPEWNVAIKYPSLLMLPRPDKDAARKRARTDEPSAVEARKMLLLPGVAERVGSLVFHFALPTADKKVIAERGAAYEAIWTTGIFDKVGNTTAPTHMARPYFSRRQQCAVSVAPWRNVLARSLGRAMQVLVVAPLDFCAIFAMFLRSQCGEARRQQTAELLFAPEWRELLRAPGRAGAIAEEATTLFSIRTEI